MSWQDRLNANAAKLGHGDGGGGKGMTRLQEIYALKKQDKNAYNDYIEQIGAQGRTRADVLNKQAELTRFNERYNALIDRYNEVYAGGKWLSESEREQWENTLAKYHAESAGHLSWLNAHSNVLGNDASAGMRQVWNQLGEMQDNAASAHGVYSQFSSNEDYMNKLGYASQYYGMSNADVDAEIERLTNTGRTNRRATDDEIVEISADLDRRWQQAESNVRDIEGMMQGRLSDEMRQYYNADTLAAAQRELDAIAAERESFYDTLADKGGWMIDEVSAENQQAIDWLNDYRGVADYAYGTRQYGYDPASMKPYEVLDITAKSDEEQAWLDNYVQMAATSGGYIGTDDWRQAAEAQRAYDSIGGSNREAILDLADSYYGWQQLVGINGEAAQAQEQRFWRKADEVAQATGMTPQELLAQVESIYPYVAQMGMEKFRAQVQAEASAHPWLTTGLTYIIQPVANLQSSAYLLGSEIFGGTPSAANPAMTAYTYNTATRGQVGADINKYFVDKYGEESGGRYGDTAEWVYNAVNSTVDSAVNMLITNGVLSAAGGALNETGRWVMQNTVSNLVMGSGAASQRFIELKQQGYDDFAAVAGAAGSGLIEGLTEAIGGERLLKAMQTYGVGFLEVLKQGLSEGIEERLANELNGLVDWLAYQDDSGESIIRKIVGLVAGYKAAGYDTDEAMRIAFSEATRENWSAFLAGMFSGGLHMATGGITQGISRTAGEYSYARAARNSAQELASINALSQQLNEADGLNLPQLAKGDNIFKVMRTVRSAAEQSNYNATKEATREVGIEVRRQVGENNDTVNNELVSAITKRTVSDAITAVRQLNKEEARLLPLTKGEEKLLKSRKVRKFIEQLDAKSAEDKENNEAGLTYSQRNRIKALDFMRANGYEGQLDNIKAADTAKALELVAKAQRVGSTFNGAKPALDTILKETPAAYQGIVTRAFNSDVESQQTAVVNDAGNIELKGVSAAGLAYINEQYRNILDEDSKAEYHENVAGAYFAGQYYGETQYAKQLMEEMYKEHGDIKAELRAVYEASVAERKQTSETVRPTAMKRGEVRNITAEEAAANGVATVDVSKLTNEQKEEAKVVRSLARQMGFSVVFFDSAGGAQEGWHQGGTIYLDVNAGYVNDRSMLRTMSHELTHFIQQYNRDAYNELRDFIVETYHDSRDEFENRLEQLMASQGISEERALDELIARGCEMMLKDSKAPQLLYERNADLYGKIAARIREWAQAIRNAIRKLMGDVRPHSAEAKRLMAVEAFANEVQQLWDEGLVGAVENMQAQKSPADSEAVQMSRRLTENDLNDYLRAGTRNNKNKAIALERSQKIILTSDAEITNFIESAIEKRYIPVTVAYGKVNSRLADAVRKESRGRIVIDDNYLELVPDDLQHAYENHSKAKDAGDIDLSADDFRKIPEYLDTFTELLYAIRYSSGRTHICVSKQIEKGRILIIETVSNSRGALQFKNAIGVSEEKYAKEYLPKYRKRAVAASRGNDSSTITLRAANDSNDNNIYEKAASVNHKSLRDDEYMTTVRNGDMATAQRMVDEAAKAAGYDRKYFHGARKGGGFTVFRDWQYFTENEEYAKRYMDRDKPESLYTVYVKAERMFDTRKARDRRVYEKYRMEQGLGGLQSDGLPDWTDGYSLSDIIDEEDLPYDGIVLNEGGDIVNGEVVSRGESYVIRKSNQVKSADPVTYDNNGNVIPLSERFNAENNDIRYSMRDEADMVAAEAAAEEAANASNREILVNALEAAAQTDLEKQKLADYRKKIAQMDEQEQKLARLRSELDNVQGDEAKKLREEIKRTENRINTYDGQLLRLEAAAPLQNVLNREKAALNAKLEEARDWRKEWRDRAKKANYGKAEYGVRDILARPPAGLTVGEEQSAKLIELQRKLVEYYEQTDEVSGKLAELTRLSNARGERDAAAINKAREALLRAEKKQADIDADITRLEQDKVLVNLAKQAIEISGEPKPPTKLAQYRKARNEKDAVDKYRKRIEATSNALTDLLLTNTDKKHVPEVLKKPLAEFLTGIDFSSQRSREGGRFTKRDTQHLERLLNLRAAMATYTANAAEGEADGYLDLPDGFADMLNTSFDTPVYDMSAAELRMLDRALTILKTAVSQSNELMVNKNYARVSEAGEATIADLDELGAAKDLGWLKGINKLFLWNNATPYYAFRRLGSAGAAMFESLQSGWDKLALNAQRVVKDSEQMYTAQEAREWGETVLDIELSNERTVKMTAAQAMSVYCLAKRQQGLGHLLGGGIKISVIDAGKGKQIAQYDNYTLTIEDLQAITAVLSERQRQVADKLQDYMGTVGAEWGNEVSMKRFGYRAFGEANYFPITSDPNNLNSLNTDAKSSDMFRLLNLSATKSLVKGANNAVVISNVFDVFAAHMADMAKYNALALPILDMVKWYNYKRREEVKSASGKKSETTHIVTATIQKSLEKAFGVDQGGKSYAAEYIKQFIKDLNGVSEAGRDMGFISTFIGRYKKAAVAANLRVVVQQPMSYARALAVMDAKYLTAGAKGNLGEAVREMQQYSGIAAWKAMGFFDTNIGRDLTEQIKHDQTFADRLSDASMYLAGKADELTWGTLWKACKAETADKGYTGNELLEKTAERFREVVYATQVVDATTTRSHLMRSNSPINKMWTAFMSEPTLTYNMMLDSVLQWHYEKRKGNKPKWRDAVGKNIIKAGEAYVVNAVLLAMATALLDAWRDDDDFETFWEKCKEALGGNILDELNPVTKVVVLKDMWDILIEGGSSDRMDTAFLTQTKKAYDVVTEWFKVKFMGADPTSTTYYGKMGGYGVIYEVLKALGGITGMPFAATSREVVSLWNNTVGSLYPNLKAKTYNEKPELGYEKLYEAMVAGDQDLQRQLIDQLHGRGLDDEKIGDGVKSVIKDMFLSGELTEEETADQLIAYCGYDATGTGSDSINYQLDRWSIEDFKMSADMEAAFAAGDGEVAREAVEYMIERYGRTESQIRSDITKYFKDAYINGSADERRRIRSLMLATGLYKADALDKQLAGWLKDKDK